LCAMSSVTLSPAIGRLAVWLLAPCTNTARSVVPAPMSTSTPPSSRSSPVSPAVLHATDDRTRSSHFRPTRLTHSPTLALDGIPATPPSACPPHPNPDLPS